MRYSRLLSLLLALLLGTSSSALLSQPTPASGVQCSQLPADTSDGGRALAAGDYAAAESRYRSALDAPSIAGYIGLVSAQLEQNHVTDALASAQKAASAMPSSGDAEALVGDALLRAGQIPEASTAYIKALTLDRCSAIGHYGWGRLNELVGRHATAAKELNIAHRLAPASAQITAAVIETVPIAQRVSLLSQFLGQHPALPPGRLQKLEAEQHQLEQHQTCSPTAEFATAEITLFPVLLTGRDVRSWGIKLAVNDAAMPLLELDSSVPGIILNPRDAEKAGIARPGAGSTPPSPNATYTAIAKHIRIGNLDFHDCPVTVAPASALADRNSLIGADFFRDHLIHIDYVAHLLTLNPLPAPQKPDAVGRTDQVFDPNQKAWTQAYIAGPKILLPTLINKKGPYLFLMDTGVNPTIYSPQITRSMLGYATDATLNLRGSSTAFVKVQPATGGVTDISDVRGPQGTLIEVARPTKLPVLRFALTEIPDHTGVTFDLTPMSYDAHTEISGLLGFEMLSYFDIEINYRDALVRITFDQNHRYHEMEAAQQLF